MQLLYKPTKGGEKLLTRFHTTPSPNIQFSSNNTSTNNSKKPSITPSSSNTNARSVSSSNSKRSVSSKRSKKRKKQRVSRSGKRPLSAFFLFMQSKRQTVKSHFPQLDHTQMVSKLGEMWRNLSEAEKGEFTDKAAELRENHLAIYNNNNADSDYRNTNRNNNHNNGEDEDEREYSELKRP